ncbi:MAG: acyl-CoA dehydratase activase, partial [Candidatus Hydromicrobium sp.]|nr:acyl-CoA dehydratase activase [Candidatus Hydromicrobium sp.]
MGLYVGYDIGSISVNRAIINEKKEIVEILPYTRHFGETVKSVKKDIESICKSNYRDKITGIGITGSGGKEIASLLGLNFINEIEAIVGAVKFLYRNAKTVIEIGGQDSKFIDLAYGDYAMNELCAAGTGSFLDQQASRFGLTIEEFTRLALKSKNPSTIAGRCSVFAKTDMIHLQQEAASDENIILGLCYAMARSFKSGIVKGKKFVPPIIFCGGVSFNEAMIKAFEDTLGEKVLIPEHRASIGAIGAALSLSSKVMVEDLNISGLADKLDEYLRNFKYKRETFAPLALAKSKLPSKKTLKYSFGNKKVDAYIGIDVGSISTNVVAIDENKKLIEKCYLRTAGRPIEAVRKGIEIIGSKVGDRINVKGVGTTGSGRYLIGDFVGADMVINEITAQATAAADIDSLVDTIFEIGGQDSKFISLENGVVVDFEMNKVCAAGTGSFLEEQAERFDIKIEDFGDIALKAESPLNLGERCTVFMETNVYSHYQKGASIEDILAGLAYSITMNYINRVVGRKKIGKKIFFQGAVAFNRSVIAAFENYLGKEVILPEILEVTGGIGTAIIVLKNSPKKTKFRGFENISKISYSHSSFECKGCPNRCEIKKISIKGQPSLFYGGRCEKYEKGDSKSTDIPDYFAERENFLLNSYEPKDNKGA